MKKWIALSLVVSFLVILSNCKTSIKPISDNNQPKIPAVKPPEFLDFDNKNIVIIADLMTSYKNNPVEADKKFKNNLYRIVGVVKEISKDKDGKKFIDLGVENSSEFGVAHCFIYEYAINQDLTQYKKGDNLTLFGTINGYTIRTNENSKKVTDINVKNCTILMNSKPITP